MIARSSMATTGRANMARSNKKRAIERSRAVGRAIAGAIAAGIVYDIAKSAARWSWAKAKSTREGSRLEPT